MSGKRRDWQAGLDTEGAKARIGSWAECPFLERAREDQERRFATSGHPHPVQRRNPLRTGTRMMTSRLP
jgi:hypothetical protein